MDILRVLKMDQPNYYKVPSLVNLTLKTLVSSNSLRICKNPLLQEFHHDDQQIIMEWERKKFYKKLAKNAHNNELHYELKLITDYCNLVEELIVIVRMMSGECNREFVRDYIVRNDINFEYMNINFNNIYMMDAFISYLMTSKYKLTILGETELPTYINDHSEFDMLCIHQSDNYYNNYKSEIRFTHYKTHNIHVRIKKTNTLVRLRITINNPTYNYPDFDVNSLSYNSHSGVTCYSNVLSDILENIKLKRFIVLSKMGTIQLQHLYYAPQKTKNDYINHSCDSSHCYCRYSIQGKALKEKILNMQKLGWEMLNEQCTNPLCILASDELFDEYKLYIIQFKKHMQTQALCDLNNKRLEYEQLKKEQIIDQSYLLSLIDITNKEINTLHFEKRSIKHTKHKKKVNMRKRNFRKYDVGKNHILIGDENYTLVTKNSKKIFENIEI